METFTSAFLNQFECMFADQLLVVAGLLAHTREHLADLPGWIHQTVRAHAREIVERHGKVHGLVDIVETSEALAKGNAILDFGQH